MGLPSKVVWACLALLCVVELGLAARNEQQVSSTSTRDGGSSKSEGVDTPNNGASTDVTPPCQFFFPWGVCFKASLTLDPVQAAVGKNVTVTVQIEDQVQECLDHDRRKAQVTPKDTHNKHKGTHTRHISDKGRRQAPPIENREILLFLSGPGAFNYPQRNQRHPDVGDTYIFIYTDVNGAATAEVEILNSGPIQVWISFFDGYAAYLPTLVTINPSQAPAPIGSPVSKLLLSPAKSYRHCDDTITLSALAMDVNSAPVANANVTFAAYGDCVPTIKQVSAVTDANGVAMITMMSHEPGAVSVVAAAVNTQGTPVFSKPSDVFFFIERHHADEREREYFGEKYDGEHRHSDADEYANIASQRVGQKMGLTA